MNICFVYQSNYPWDIRVQKIARSLTNAGHNLTIVSSNELGKERQESTDEAEVIRLPSLLKGPHVINEILNFPLFFNPLWINTIKDTVVKKHVDLIIVRDLPLALTACKVGEKFNIPVIMDMAECYPELLRSIWQFGAGSFIKYFTHNPKLGDIVERRAIRKLDHIIAMIEESKIRLEKMGCDKDKVSIVSNTPPISKFVATNITDHQSNDETIRICYAGWINKGRGVDKAIEGVSEFVKTNDKNIHLDVFGDGDAMDLCKELIRDGKLEDVVKLHGWVDQEVVVEHTQLSHIGLVSHRVCSHWNNTIPNKLFDYMASGLPILTSNAIPAKRIVNEEQCGAVYVDDDKKSFSDALSHLVSRDERIRMGNNGVNAVKRRYHWEYDEAQLLKIVDQYS